MKLPLMLHCDADQSLFVLSKQGEHWRQRFTDLRTALDHARTVVSEETALLIHNELGRVIIETVVSPDGSRQGGKHV